MNRHIADELTIIIPAYNEEKSLGDTILSVQKQTKPPKKIIVVDDFSTDSTNKVAKSFKGVTVLRPSSNTGSKAGAQNFVLKRIKTKYVMAIDADTTLAPNALEKLLPALEGEKVAAVCGFVLPRHVRTIWERGRYIEYLFAFTFYKPIQDYYGNPLISSGCFSAYKTAILKELGGWSTRTRAEDMDLTWSFYEKGYQVKFVPEAVCYPIEPHNYDFMSKQLKRWSHGFIQNVVIHWHGIIHLPYLSSLVGIALWDAIVASIAYLFLLPLLAILTHNALFLLGYLIDAPAIILPVIIGAINRKEIFLALACIPSFFILRTVNGFFLLKALLDELVLRKPLLVYEKGH